jgi:Brp/Blh family beta-carotene 15,15'-monooxygenase
MTTQRLVRLVVCVGWIANLGAITLALAAPEVARLAIVQWSPWLLGLFALGIPHGAFDHRVGAELTSTANDPSINAAGPLFYAAYLAAVFAVVLVWFVSPMVASVGFLMVAAIHFGQGDVYWSRRFGLAARTSSVGYRASLLVARSALPIAWPLLAFPGELAGTAGILASRLFGRASWSISPEAIRMGLILVGLVVGLQLAWAAWLGFRGDLATKQAARGDIAETLLLVALFGIVPPVLALGIYFNTWHSIRHVIRLLLLNRLTNEWIESGRWLDAFREFLKRTLPMTCGAFVLLIALGFVLGRSLISIVDLGLVGLVALSALTLPHFLVVCWMDARQGIWLSRPDQS